MTECVNCHRLLKETERLQKMLKVSTEEVFWWKVDRRGPTECWPWLGALNGQTGYGGFHIPGRTSPVSAHRFAYEVTYGPTPLSVLHRCDTRACVNPRHLFAGSQADNVADQRSKNRHLRKLTPAAIIEIRQRYVPGVGVTALAREFGINRTYLHAVATGKVLAA